MSATAKITFIDGSTLSVLDVVNVDQDDQVLILDQEDNEQTILAIRNIMYVHTKEVDVD